MFRKQPAISALSLAFSVAGTICRLLAKKPVWGSGERGTGAAPGFATSAATKRDTAKKKVDDAKVKTKAGSGAEAEVSTAGRSFRADPVDAEDEDDAEEAEDSAKGEEEEDADDDAVDDDDNADGDNKLGTEPCGKADGAGPEVRL